MTLDVSVWRQAGSPTLNLGTRMVLNQPISAENHFAMSDVAVYGERKLRRFPSISDLKPACFHRARFSGNNACTYTAFNDATNISCAGRLRRGNE